MKKTIWKRLISSMLVFAMVLSLAPQFLSPPAKAAGDNFSTGSGSDGWSRETGLATSCSGRAVVALYHAGDTFPGEPRTQSRGNYIQYTPDFENGDVKFDAEEILKGSDILNSETYVLGESNWGYYLDGWSLKQGYTSATSGIFDPNGVNRFFTDNFNAALEKHEQTMIQDVLDEKGLSDANPADYDIVWYIIKYQTYDSMWHINGLIHEQDKYSVTYDGNGHTAGSPPNGVIDMSYSAAKAYTVSGNTNGLARNDSTGEYDFIGWNTKADGTGTFYSAGQVADLTKVTDNEGKFVTAITLYAQWAKKQTYTVTWYDSDSNDNNKKVVHMDTGLASGTEVPYDGATPTKAPDENHTYTFSHWEDINRNTVIPPIEVTDNIDLFAQYTSNDRTYTITWVNHTVIHTDTDLSYNDTVTYNGDTPTRSTTETEGYAFIGWATTENPVAGETVYTLNHPFTVTRDMTFYARFTLVPMIAVNWYNEDGTLLHTDKALKGSSLTYDGPDHTKVGHTFTGWSATKGGSVAHTSNTVTVAANATDGVTMNLYAIYTPETYTVTWMSGSTTLETDSAVTYGSVPKYNGNAPTKTSSAEKDYVFAGWQKDGTGTVYTADTFPAVTENVTYKAYFTETDREYTVSWLNAGGEESLGSQQVAYGGTPVYSGTTPTWPATDTHTHTFSGWWHDANSNGKQDEGEVYAENATLPQVTGNITYIAAYNAVSITFTATVKVWKDPVFTDGIVTSGTLADLSSLTNYADTALYLRDISDATKVYALSKSATGTYTATLTHGTYQVVVNDGSGYSLLTDERIILPHPAVSAGDPDTTTADILFYSVTYDLDGGSVNSATADIVKYYKRGTHVFVDNTIPTRAGYLFDGWLLDGGTELYEAGRRITAEGAGIAQPHMLKAMWIPSQDSVVVNVTILHHDSAQQGINPHYKEGTLNVSLTHREIVTTGTPSDYYEKVGFSTSTNSWYSESNTETNGNECITKLTNIYSVNGLPSNWEYSANVTMEDYWRVGNPVITKTTANGNTVYTIDVTLQYNPDLFRLAYTVNIDPNMPADMVPAAVDLKILSYDAVSAGKWDVISRHQNTTIDEIFTNTDRTAQGSYNVPVHKTNDSLFYYRVAAAGFTLPDGTELSASGGLVNYTSDATQTRATYQYNAGAYTAVVEVKNGAANVGGVPAVYGTADGNGSYTQAGSITVTVYAHPHTVTFDLNDDAENPATLNGSSEDAVVSNLFHIPVLGNYAPTRGGNYVFDGWYLPDGTKAVSNTPISNNVTLKAKWKAPWTVKGEIRLDRTYILDTSGNKVNVPDSGLPDSLDVVLYRTYYLNGAVEDIQMKSVEVNKNQIGDEFIVNYTFDPVAQDGSTYRVYVAAANFDEKFLVEPNSNTPANVTDKTKYGNAQDAVDNDSDNDVTVHAWLTFNPDEFNLNWNVDASAISGDFRPDSLGVVVQCSDHSGANYANWPIISQHYDQFEYRPETTVIDGTNGLGSGSFPVWQINSESEPYEYAAKVYNWTEGGDTTVYDATTAPFTVTHSPAVAWYANGQTTTAISGKNYIGIVLTPKTYTITYDLNAGGDTVSGFVNAPEKHTWSKATLGIPTGLTRVGYDFMGWNTKADGTGIYYNDSIPADIAQNITLTAQWKQQKKVTFQVVNGTWSDATTADIVKYVSLDGNDNGTVTVPTGMNPLYGYGNGSWSNASLNGQNSHTFDNTDATPVTYTYTFQRKTVTVTYSADDPASNSTLDDQTESMFYGNYIRVDPVGGSWQHGTTYLTATDFKIETDTVLADPTREGYIFAGWSLHYLNDTIHDDGIVTRRFSAVWLADENKDGTPDVYQKKVTFTVVNGTWLDNGTPIKTITHIVSLKVGNTPSLSGTANISDLIPSDITPDSGFLAANPNPFWTPTLPTGGIVSGTGDLVFTYRHYTEISYTDFDRSMSQSKYPVLPGTVITLDPADGVTQPYIEAVNGPYGLTDPSREGYTFKGWKLDNSTNLFTAQWEQNKYTVTWKNDNGVVLETDSNVVHGTTPEYNGATPTKNHTAQYSYTFIGWKIAENSTVYAPADLTNLSVVGHTTFTAVYSETVNKYTVTWVNHDGSVLETDEGVAYGTTPEYDGKTPEKAPDAQYTYTFDKWSPAVEAVTGNVTYTATYTPTLCEYTVTWVNWDNTVLETDEDVQYGTIPTYDKGLDPIRPDDDLHKYTFLHWTPTISAVTGNVTYKALYNQVQVRFPVTLKVWLDDVAADLTTVLNDSGAKPELRPVSSGNAIPLTKQEGTGIYQANVPNGTYALYLEGGTEPVCGQTIIVENGAVEKNCYYHKVTYNAAGGAPDSVECHHEGSVVNVTDAPARNGHIFLGWWHDIDKDSTVDENELYHPGSTLTNSIVDAYTLTAQWVETMGIKVNVVIDHVHDHGTDSSATKGNVRLELVSRASDTDPWMEVDGTVLNLTDSSHNGFTYNAGNGESTYTASDVTYNGLRKDWQYNLTAIKEGYERTNVVWNETEKSLTVYLEYAPDDFELNFSVTTSIIPAEARPSAAIIRVLRWNGASWDYIPQHGNGNPGVYVPLQSDGTGSGSVTVRKENGSTPDDYRIEVSSFVYDGNVYSASTPATGDDHLVKYTDHVYTATIQDVGDVGSAHTHEGLKGAYWNNNGTTDTTNDDKQTGVLKAVISLNLYDVIFKANGGSINNQATLTEPSQYKIPNLTQYVPVHAPGYLFEGWYADNNYTIPAVSGSRLTGDVTLYAKWKNPLTVSGTITVGATFLLDHDNNPDTSVQESVLPDYNRIQEVTVLLQYAPADTNHFTTQAAVTKTITYPSDKTQPGTATYDFADLTNDGTWRIQVLNHCYVDTYQNEASDEFSVADDSLSSCNVAVDASNPADDIAKINVNMAFSPHYFDLYYKVLTDGIGEGFLPQSAEVLVLYDNNVLDRADPRSWPVISQMDNGNETYTGQNSTVGEANSYPVWIHHAAGHLYDYAIAIQAVDGDTLDAGSLFTAEYNGIAQYQASGGYNSQTQLLTATLKPKSYPVIYYLEQGSSTEILGMTVNSHTWSHETTLKNAGQWIDVPYRGPGYTFTGWVDGSGNDVSSISANTAQETKLYATWFYTVTWVDQDGDVLEIDENVAYNTVPTYDNQNGMGTPAELAAEENTAQHTYTFMGWMSSLTGETYTDLPAVTAPVTFTAVYETTVKNYTVTWVDWNGTALEEDKDNVPYGSAPNYGGSTPVKADDARYTYTHSGWQCSVDGHIHNKDEMSSVIVTGNVTFTAVYSETPQTYTVYWRNEDGSLLKKDENVAYGQTPTYDPNANPTKESDAQYTYTFAGWSPAISPVTGDTAYFATYSATVNEYNVKWVNWDGTELETDENVAYGTTPTYDGATPTKAENARFTYTHSGWSPEVASVTGDVTYTATFQEITRHYTVTWVDEDDTVLETDANMFYGAISTYNSGTPSKNPTAEFTYTFAGWQKNSIGDVLGTPEKPLPTVDGNVTYKAVYTSTKNKYTVIWKNYDGTVLEVDENVEYGTAHSYNGATPTRPNTAQHNFSWQGWDTALSTVTGNTVFTAVFVDNQIHYTVTWKNHDGTVLETDENVPYGAAPVYNGTIPSKTGDAQYTHSFTGWTPAVGAITGDTVYTATFNSILNKYTVTWVNWDDTVLETDKNVLYGTVPTYNGSTPTRPNTAAHTYIWNQWDKEVSSVTGDVTYKAIFVDQAQTYDITYTDGVDGTELFTDQVHTSVSYGSATPAFSGTPARPGYIFIGWTPKISATVTGDVTYTAQWEMYIPAPTTGTVILTKVDSVDTAKTLSGVVFDLYKANGTKVGAYTTDSNGQITRTLNAGDYYWLETRPAEGYVMDNEKKSFTVRAGQTHRMTLTNTHAEVPGVFGTDHYAFVIGSTDGLVHPEANITRAEVATIYFRMLNEETRNQYLTTVNSFSDVNEGDWYNTAVSTMAAMGVIGGYPDGTFCPSASITRAEFIAFAAHFDPDGDTTPSSFTDIEDHWAKDEINIAANNGWTLGNGTTLFNPDTLINRAEAMALINRVLQRIPESTDDLLDDMIVWPDNMDTSKWYYLAIQEASNSHNYVRKNNGFETWTELTEAPDWKQFE